MDEVFAKICEDFGKGRIDILINNAGVSSMGAYPELTEKEWELYPANVRIMNTANATAAISEAVRLAAFR